QRLRSAVVEFHTGEYAHAGLDGDSERAARELERIARMSKLAREMGIEMKDQPTFSAQEKKANET
ncbi:MAG TPA: hypothetical protein EYQ00_05825, partial [Dehalococcoidia bacterium]|nr:hypothetical protein [Dehalococcoidia bacterium]